jgi:hypothetical protein
MLSVGCESAIGGTPTMGTARKCRRSTSTTTIVSFKTAAAVIVLAVPAVVTALLVSTGDSVSLLPVSAPHIDPVLTIDDGVYIHTSIDLYMHACSFRGGGSSIVAAGGATVVGADAAGARHAAVQVPWTGRAAGAVHRLVPQAGIPRRRHLFQILLLWWFLK